MITQPLLWWRTIELTAQVGGLGHSKNMQTIDFLFRSLLPCSFPFPLLLFIIFLPFPSNTLSFIYCQLWELTDLLKRHRYVKTGILLPCNPSVVCACHQGVMGAPISDATYLTILCKSNEVLTMKLWGFAKCDSQWWDVKSMWIWSYSPYEQATKSSVNDSLSSYLIHYEVLPVVYKKNCCCDMADHKSLRFLKCYKKYMKTTHLNDNQINLTGNIGKSWSHP